MAEKKQFILRISPELWEDLQRWAADELRSANAQMEYVLRKAVEERKKGRELSGQIRCPEGSTQD
jgi:hypothetical protein